MSSLDRDIVTPGRPQTCEVSPGVYAYIQPDGTWWINNTGFLTGPQGVISIDSCATRRRTQAYLDAIAGVTRAPVRAVINTHHHGDHTFGNCLFPGAAIIAHERARAEAIAFGPPRDLPFWDGPDWGDLTLMGSVSGAIEVLEGVITPLGARTIVPGHGPVFEGTGPIEQTLEYLRFVQRAAADGRNAGLTPLEAAREADLRRFAQWPDAERIAGNLHRAYAELDGAPPGAPIDVIAALADMVAYNGGAPLTCLA